MKKAPISATTCAPSMICPSMDEKRPLSAPPARMPVNRPSSTSPAPARASMRTRSVGAVEVSDTERLLWARSVRPRHGGERPVLPAQVFLEGRSHHEVGDHVPEAELGAAAERDGFVGGDLPAVEDGPVARAHVLHHPPLRHP